MDNLVIALLLGMSLLQINFASKRGNEANKYVVTSVKMSWKDSRKFCRELGGDLATSIKDWNDRIALVHNHQLVKNEAHYIGLYEEPEGVFHWVDDPTGIADPSDIHWNTGEPDNNEGGKHCGQMASHVNWRTADRPCHYKHFAICEVSSAYFISEDRFHVFEEAKSFCTKNNAALVEYTTAKQYKKVIGWQYANPVDRGYWTGMTYRQVPSKHEYVRKKSAVFTSDKRKGYVKWNSGVDTRTKAIPRHIMHTRAGANGGNWIRDPLDKNSYPALCKKNKENDPVCSSPCLNGGVCIAPDTCSCTGGYKGDTCADDPLKGKTMDNINMRELFTWLATTQQTGPVGFTAKFYVKSPDKLARYRELVAQSIGYTLTQPGNIMYKFFEDFNDPLVFWLIEEWESVTELNNHVTSEVFQNFIMTLQNEGLLQGEQIGLFKEMY